MKQEDFNEEFRQRTKALAFSIIHLLSPLKYSEALSVIRLQAYRASTSVASNFRAVCRARSEREKFSKLCTVVEEADETIFWLEMIVEGKFVSAEEAKDAVKESTEILKVMSAYKKHLEPKPKF